MCWPFAEGGRSVVIVQTVALAASWGQRLARGGFAPSRKPATAPRGAPRECRGAYRVLAGFGNPTTGRNTMKIDKDQILDLLRSQGDEGKAQQAEQELPDQVDTERDSGLLNRFGLNVDDIKGRLGGLFG
jgi:hypothetical protein